MTDHTKPSSESTVLGGEPLIFPGEEAGSQLPPPRGPHVPPDLQKEF